MKLKHRWNPSFPAQEKSTESLIADSLEVGYRVGQLESLEIKVEKLTGIVARIIDEARLPDEVVLNVIKSPEWEIDK